MSVDRPELAQACPHCSAQVGEVCRTITFKRVAGGSHEARLQAHYPRYKTENRALCCQCGNLRTVSHKHSFSFVDDATTHDGDDDRHPGRHWRMTGRLTCGVCDEPTVHALLRDSCLPEHRDYAERREYGLAE